jgi:uncharacterized NAD-dependent epimerase/dehydratase family protein
MEKFIDGPAIVYCEGAFNTPNGKTAHGLVRYTRRYQVIAVIDSKYAGKDAGEILDGKKKNIPILASLEEAYVRLKTSKSDPKYFVVGLAPDGGRLSPGARQDVRKALMRGLNVDSGLHDFLTEDVEMATLAAEKQLQIRDVRKIPPRNLLHFFSGKIEEVSSLKVAVLGTDSAVGKRTTAWLLVQALEKSGFKADLIGTGQTAWMQGAQFSLILDSLINDFVSGEIEHAVWSAWKENRPDVIVIEGQGSMLNPAYPGGFEILAAARPDIIVLQHAPARKEYDGFPGYPLHPLSQQIDAIEIIAKKPVVAITINHENLGKKDIPAICLSIEMVTGIPTSDTLIDRGKAVARVVEKYL